MRLLNGVRVLEVSLHSPDALGGHLADLGADVIKIESSRHNSGIRGPGSERLRVLSWRWNRGKRSVFLDLKADEHRQLFLELAKDAHVVIDGLRAGAMERLGLAYEDIKSVNPGIVYCSLSGQGQDGPYRNLATHGLAFDAFAGLARPVIAEDGSPQLPRERSLFGIHAGPLYAGMGVLAALLHHHTTGEGSYLDVAQLDAAITWRSGVIDAIANDVTLGPAPGEGVRFRYYETSDAEYILLMAIEDKFWKHFCLAVERPDLKEHPGAEPRSATADEIDELVGELTALFKSKTRAEWVDLFLAHDVAGSPVYLGEDILEDGHVTAHGLVIDQQQADGSSLRLLGSPIRVRGQVFDPPRAPKAGEHTDEILSTLRTSTGYGSAQP